VDGDDDDLSFLIARAKREITSLREDPRLVAAAGTRGAALRSHVLDLLGAVEHRLAAAPTPASSAVARRAFARTVRQGVFALQSAHRALPWVQATRQPHLNLGSLYLAEEFARDLIGPDVDLVVVPDNDYMYSTTSWPFRGYIEAAHGYTAQTIRRPIVLNFPLTDAHRLLLHPIFAHELGHSSVDEHGLCTELVKRMRAEPSFAPARKAAVDAVQAQAPGAPRANIEATIDEMLVDWSTELLCDALGLEAGGPAFLLALVSFLIALGYGESGDKHPPTTARIKVALEHLRARGWDAYLARHAPVLTSWFDKMAGDATPAVNEPTGFLRDTLLAHAGDIEDIVAGRLGGAALDAAACQRDADRAAKLLKLDILPVEYEGRLSRLGILTGGWQHALAIHGDSPDALVDAIADDRLQDLLGKALELNAVLEAWETL
jgi:hypothetical protein